MGRWRVHPEDFIDDPKAFDDDRVVRRKNAVTHELKEARVDSLDARSCDVKTSLAE